MTFKEGDRVATCGQTSGFHKDGFFFATKVYEAVARKKDGVLIWKLTRTLNEIACGDHRFRGDIPSPAALKLARVFAQEDGIPFLINVKANQEVASTKVPGSQAKKVKSREPKGDRLARVLRNAED